MEASYCPHHIISANNKYQIPCKISDCEHPLRTWNGVVCYKERHSLLLERVIISLWYTRMFRWASGCIYNQFMIHTVSFLPTTNVRFQAKCQISGTLSALEPGWCDARRDINCYLSILYPSSDIVGWVDEPLIASKSPLWSILCHF